MPFCYCPRNFVSKVVSTKRSRAIGEEEKNRVAMRGHEKKGDFEGEVYQNQKTSKPFIYFF